MTTAPIRPQAPNPSWPPAATQPLPRCPSTTDVIVQIIIEHRERRHVRS